MAFRDKYQWIVRLWRISFLFLGFAALVLAVLSWMLTGDLTPVFLATCTLALGACSVYILFSVNIFRRRMRTLQPPSERLFVYMSALGIYLAVVAAIFFATSFLLLKVIQMPVPLVIVTVGIELAAFSAVGYMGFIRMRRTMRWLSENSAPVNSRHEH
jgi:hypothetical protein